MKTRYYALTAILLAGSFTMNAQTKKTAKATVVAPAQEKLTILDSASYSFGLKVAQGLKSDGVDRLNYSLLAKAMEDVFNGRETLLTDEQASSSIGIFLEAANKSRFATLLEEGEKFLAENKVKAGITSTESGLQYEVLKDGSGATPKLDDDVTVHYKGSLLNGKQFDSSYDRGEPIELQLNRVIPGWTEGLQLMKQGSKYRFFIPYQLAYGERGAGQDIPPYSTLIFEVELIKIGK